MVRLVMCREGQGNGRELPLSLKAHHQTTVKDSSLSAPLCPVMCQIVAPVRPYLRPNCTFASTAIISDRTIMPQ